MATTTAETVGIKFDSNFAEFNANLKKLTASFDRFNASMEKGTAGSKRVRKAMVATGQAGQKAAQGTSMFSRTVSRLAQQIRLIEGPLGGTAARFSTFSAIVRAGTGPLAAVTVAVSLLSAGMGVLGVVLFKAQRELEPIIARFRIMEGSMGGARAKMADLAQMSLKLGIDFKAAAQNFSTFSIAAKNAGLSTTEIQGVFEGVSTAASALNLEADATSRIFLALEQMVSKGTVSMEELRKQLGNALPGAMQSAAKAMNVTVGELMAMVKAGDLLAKDLLPALGKQLTTDFGEAAKWKALNKELNKASTQLTLIWQILLDMGASDLFTEGAKAFNSVLDSIRLTVAEFKVAAMQNIIGAGASTGPAVSARQAQEASMRALGAPTGSSGPRLTARQAQEGSMGALGRMEAAELAPIHAKAVETAAQLKQEFMDLRDEHRQLTNEATMDNLWQQYEAGVDAFHKQQKKALAEQKKFQVIMERGAAIAQANLTPFEIWKKTQAELNVLHEQGAISLETYQRAQAKSNRLFAETNEHLQIVGGGLRAFGDTLIDSFQRGETASKSFKSAITDMVNHISRKLHELLIYKPLDNLLEGFAGSFASSIGGGFGNLFSAGGGNTSPGIFGTPSPAFGAAGARSANGGSARAGMPVIVGERGTEKFVPSTDGTIVPNHQLGGGQAPQVNVNVSTQKDEEVSTSQDGSDINVVIVRTVAQDIARGGQIRQAIQQTFNASTKLAGR